MDDHQSGLIRTLDVLDRDGLDHVGTYRTQAERDKNSGILMKEINGVRIAFLSYTYGTNGLPVTHCEYAANILFKDYMSTDMENLDYAFLDRDMLGTETYNKYLERGNIEVAPLAYMRGRTLDDSFIILDEAQNTSREQMKMFLTRIGFGSKVVITGDITQVDLPQDKQSGLKEAMRVRRRVAEADLQAAHRHTRQIECLCDK